MTLRYFFSTIAVMLILMAPIAVSAQSPIKWSVPIHEYPSPWEPTQAPPQYAPWGGGFNQQNYSGYGYGGWPYSANTTGGYYPNYGGQGNYGGGWGNPYNYFYGQ